MTNLNILFFIISIFIFVGCTLPEYYDEQYHRENLDMDINISNNIEFYDSDHSVDAHLQAVCEDLSEKRSGSTFPAGYDFSGGVRLYEYYFLEETTILELNQMPDGTYSGYYNYRVLTPDHYAFAIDQPGTIRLYNTHRELIPVHQDLPINCYRMIQSPLYEINTGMYTVQFSNFTSQYVELLVSVHAHSHSHLHNDSHDHSHSHSHN